MNLMLTGVKLSTAGLSYPQKSKVIHNPKRAQALMELPPHIGVTTKTCAQCCCRWVYKILEIMTVERAN